MTGDPVEIGTPISDRQATLAILRMIRSPIVGNVDLDPSPGYTIERIKKESYDLLSGGEKKLVDIAESIWCGPLVGARISVLGGLDRTNRRKVLMVLLYLYLGRDVMQTELALPESVFAEMFL